MTSLANSSNTTDHCVHRKTPVSIKFIHLGMLVTLLLCENVAALVMPSTNYNTISRHPYYRRTTRLPSTLFYRDETDPMEAKELSANMIPKKEKPSDFQSRMKRIIVQQRPTTSQQRQKSGSSYRPDNIQTVVSLDEFSKVIDEGRRENKLIVVRFFATWCKTCHSLRPSFDKVASNNPHTIFLDVPVTETNTNLHQGLGVPSVPYSHIYHPEKGLVEESKMSRQSLSEFEELIEKHSS